MERRGGRIKGERRSRGRDSEGGGEWESRREKRRREGERRVSIREGEEEIVREEENKKEWSC